MKIFRNLIAAAAAAILLSLTACTSGSDMIQVPMTPSIENTDNTRTPDAPEPYFTPQTTVAQVLAEPCFADFGRLLFPVDRNVSPSMTLAQVSTTNVYVWYPYIRLEKTLEILDYLRSEALSGRQIFYNIYSPQEMAADSSKADTGLFVFRGETGRPFAVTNAGGGFVYVGAMHDSFPHSLELSRNGYTAFALIYRPDDPYRDLARALEFITANADALGVAPEDYSLWGGSAGARMAATLGNKIYLDQLTGGSVPQAAAVIMQYTGYYEASAADAPTYACVGSNDGIASWRTMRDRLQRLSSMGIPTEFHVYEGLGHGFGLGTGTVAQGWISDAIRFWQANMRGNSGIPLVHAD